MKTKTTTKNPPLPKDVILIATTIVEQEGTRGLLEKTGSKLNTVASIASDKLAENLGAFSKQFGNALSAMGDVCGEYVLDEVTVTVELGVEGEVVLLGSGASASGKAGLEMVFKRVIPNT